MTAFVPAVTDFILDAARRSGLATFLTVVTGRDRRHRPTGAILAASMLSNCAIDGWAARASGERRGLASDFRGPAVRYVLGAMLAFGLVCDASAQTAVDANTITLHGNIYRLWGIDAPDREQTCSHDWPAGREAMKTLIGLMQGKKIECEGRGHDREGRVLALCRADGADLGAAMVRAGMAWADLPTSHDYVLQEARATADYVGVHAYQCKTAWDWRAARQSAPERERQGRHRPR